MKSTRLVPKGKTTISRQGTIGTQCNDAIAAYTRIFQVPYDPLPRDECKAPTAAEEGVALNKAKELFGDVAAAYCSVQNGKCGEGTTCRSIVMITSVENLGVVAVPEEIPGEKPAEKPGQTPAEKPKGKVRCTIKFKVVGSITCTCQSPHNA